MVHSRRLAAIGCRPVLDSDPTAPLGGDQGDRVNNGSNALLIAWISLAVTTTHVLADIALRVKEYKRRDQPPGPRLALEFTVEEESDGRLLLKLKFRNVGIGQIHELHPVLYFSGSRRRITHGSEGPAPSHTKGTRSPVPGESLAVTYSGYRLKSACERVRRRLGRAHPVVEVVTQNGSRMRFGPNSRTVSRHTLSELVEYVSECDKPTLVDIAHEPRSDTTSKKRDKPERLEKSRCHPTSITACATPRAGDP